MKFWQKTIAVVATFALLLNSFVAPLSVLAEETSSPEPTTTPTVEPTATPTESPTIQPTIEPTESTTPVPTDTASPEPTTEVRTPTTTIQPTETQTPETSPTIQEEAPKTSEKNIQLNAVILENEKVDESILNNFDLDYTEDGSASVTTDKPDYAQPIPQL